MSKTVWVREIPEGYKVNYYLKDRHEKSDECYKTIERSLDGVKNFFDKPDMPPPGFYHVKPINCYMKDAIGKCIYGKVEFEVTSGKYKGRVFFSVLAGGFDIKVEHQTYMDRLQCVVTEIHQDQDIKFDSRQQEKFEEINCD